jgi:hypothetical protein
MRAIDDNKEGLALNGAHEILVYTDDFNLLGDKIGPNTAKKKQTHY